MFIGVGARRAYGQKVIALMVPICLACMADLTRAHAQQADSPTLRAATDCEAFVESSRKLARASQDMLNQLREEQNKIEKMRNALGEDVANEFLVHLSNQEKRLIETLRDTDTLRCPLPSKLDGHN